MSRRDASGEGGRRPRVPGWLLAAIVAGCLAAAGWMFWADARIDDSPREERSSETDRDLAEGVLDVPEDVEGDDAGSGRSDQGRDRLDEGREGIDEQPANEDDEPTGDEDTPLPAVFAHLAGRTIALAPASADAVGDADRLVRVGALRVACAGAADADRLGAELAMLERVREVLERADARVVTLAGDDGTVPCVDARVRRFEAADLALVLRGGAERARVLRARPAGDAHADAAIDAAFPAHLAGVLELDGPAGQSAATRTLLAATGALDLAGGGVVAFVEPVASTDDAADEVALALARAMALTLADARA